ncbi:serine hydrolase-domain-containing protein [Macrophomina phaseolina]|uniref:Serine hydrolase-domain-containing protein n=1 Tax=Macrophomina phaseolina TaxID=35725 RepID=A0ABQ8G4D4_9PEZI|nr:serine hydrolase-domain-containing protein [Macrophomina phaseolina]
MTSADRTAKLRIVCLHGFSCNSAIFRFQTARLRSRWAEHLRQHPLVAVLPDDSPSPSASWTVPASPDEQPWRGNNTLLSQDYYESDTDDNESSSSATASSVDLAASISSMSSFSGSGSSSGSAKSSKRTEVVYNDVEFIFLESPREVSASMADSPEQPLAEVASLFPGPYRTWFQPSGEIGAVSGQWRARRRDPAVERWLVERVKQVGGVHGVLAFSDGAALTAALTLKAEAGLNSCPKLWDFVVLACGVDPYPDPWLHSHAGGGGGIGGGGGDGEQEAAGIGSSVCSARLKTPGLHIIGLRDEAYRGRSEALWRLVHPQAVAAAGEDGTGSGAPAGMAAEVYRFDDGHKVPVQDHDLAAALAMWRKVVVRSGLFRDASAGKAAAASRA